MLTRILDELRFRLRLWLLRRAVAALGRRLARSRRAAAAPRRPVAPTLRRKRWTYG
jgi:hypothetical protein